MCSVTGGTKNTSQKVFHQWQGHSHDCQEVHTFLYQCSECNLHASNPFVKQLSDRCVRLSVYCQKCTKYQPDTDFHQKKYYNKEIRGACDALYHNYFIK